MKDIIIQDTMKLKLLIAPIFAGVLIAGYFFGIQKLENYVYQEAKALLPDIVKIQDININFLAHVNFKGISIQDISNPSKNILTADNLKIRINLFKGIINRNISVISSLTLEKPIIQINHYANDRFNILTLFEDLDFFKEQETMDDINLNIFIKQGILKYYDERGFSNELLKNPVTNTLYDINGFLTYKNGKLELKALWGKLNKDNNNIFINGKLESNSFQINMESQDCEIADIVNYIIPIKEIELKEANGDINITISNNMNQKKGDLPVSIKVQYESKNSKVKLAFLQESFTINTGNILVTNDGIKLNKIVAKSQNDSVFVQGEIKDFHKINIAINGNNNDLDTANRMFAFLKPLNLSGKADFRANILTNEQDKVLISGYIENFTGNVLSYRVDEASLSFTFLDNKVDLLFPELKTYKGIGRGYGYVELSREYPPYISLAIDIGNIDINNYFLTNQFLGNIDLSLRIDSYTEDLRGMVNIQGVDSTIFGQRLLQARLFWGTEKNKINFFSNSFAILNNKEKQINFQGFLKKDNSFSVTVNNSTLESSNLYFFYTNTQNYKFQTTFSGSLAGVYDEKFKNDPVSGLSGKLQGKIDYFQVTSPNSSMTGNMELLFDKTLTVSTNVHENAQNIFLKATIKKKTLSEVSLKTSTVNIALAKTFLKPLNFDYNGFISCDVVFFENSNKLFLNNLGASGNISLFKGNIASQNIDFFNGKISLLDNKLIANNSRLVNGDSNFVFSAEYQSIQNLKVNFLDGAINHKGWLLFPEFIRGHLASITGNLEVIKNKYSFNLYVELEEPYYQGVFLPYAKGNIKMINDKIFFENIFLNHYKDQYKVSGDILLKKTDSTIFPFNFTVDIINAELKNIIELINNVQINWRNKKEVTTKQNKANESIFNFYQQSLQKEVINLYSIGGENISSILEELALTEENENEELLTEISGTLQGDLHVSYLEDFLLSSDLFLRNGKYKFFQAEETRFLSKLKETYFDISLQSQGANLLNKFFEEINLFAKYFPEKREIEIGNLFAKINKNYTSDIVKGIININSFFTNKINDDALNLYVLLNKSDIDILTLFNKMFAKIKNEGSLLFHITGSFQKPIIDAEEAILKNFQIDFAENFLLRTPIKIPYAKLELQNNILQLPKDMPIYWQGIDTMGNLNEIISNGEINFKGFSNNFGAINFDTNLIFNPMIFHVDLKDFFHGKLNLSQTSIKGNYSIPIKQNIVDQQNQEIINEREKGPILKTKATIEDGVYYLPLGTNNANKGGLNFKPSLLLDIEMILGKNILITEKIGDEDINRWFTNMNIVFEERPETTRVKGSLNTIDTEGIFKFRTGRIVFMNKIFNIMDRQKQREIFGAGSSKIADNFVEIKMETHPQFPNKRKATPYFNFRTYSEIQSQVASTLNNVYEENVFVIFVEGPFNDLSSFFIEHYKKTDSGYSMVDNRIYLDAMTSEQVDKVISYLVPAVFRPDFYRSLLEEGLADNQEANAMLREYSASQINLWIDQQLRPFEQEIAKNMGLYDVNINHDLGKEFVNAMRIFQGPEQFSFVNKQEDTLSVEYVKDLFFEKFFVKVRTGISQDPTKPLLNMSQYELVWFLDDVWSLNYGNYNLNNLDSMYGAFSINANFIF
jgi:hypothetical protein